MYFLFLGLTLALEAPFYLLGLRGRSGKQRLVLWLLANLVSYPPVFFFFPYLPWSPLACELAAEVWAPLCEIGVAHFLLPKVTSAERMLILGANLFSWLVGAWLIKAILQHTSWLD